MTEESLVSRLDRVADSYLRVVDLLGEAINRLAIFLGGLLVLIVFGRVIGRYVFDTVPIWAPELSTYLAIWISLLLIGPLIKDDNHLKVTLVYNKLPFKWKQIVYSIHLGLIFIFGAVFLVMGYRYSVGAGWASVTPGMGIANFYIYIWIPIAGGLIMLFTVAQAIEVARNPEQLEAEQRRFEEQRQMDQEAKRSREMDHSEVSDP